MYHVYNIEEHQVSPEKLILKSPNKNIPNLDMIPGSIFLHRAELKLSMISGREMVLQGFIDDNRAFFESNYDYILIDTNPSMSIVNQNAFLVSDSIVLVSDVSMNAIEGSQLFMALWEASRRRLKKENNVKAFVINDFDRRNKLSRDFLDFLQTSEELSDIREIKMNTIIPRNIKITESELAAIPISLYDIHSKGCEAISLLIEEFLSKGIL